MFRRILGVATSAFVAHAAESSRGATSGNLDVHGKEQCGVCRSPEMTSQLSSLLTAEDGTYRLPSKRKLISIKPFTNLKYMYTSSEITPTGQHLGDFTDYKTFGVARRWAINQWLEQPTTLHVPYQSRYTSTELQRITSYYENPDYDEIEIDYRIPSDPQKREEELGTNTENNVPLLLHKDGSISALHCPTTYTQLSHSTWTYLHTMAAYYPEQPNNDYQEKTINFIQHFASLYPCQHCSEHMKEFIQEHPITAKNNVDLSIWMCTYHNHVNASLGKRIINCSPDYLLHRYKEGYPAEAKVKCGDDDQF